MTRGGAVMARNIFDSEGWDERDLEWDFACHKFLRLERYIFVLRAVRSYGSIELTGNVASEQIKDVIEEIFHDYDPDAEVANALVVTAPFRPAEDDDDYIVEMKGSLTIEASPATKTVPVDRYPKFLAEDKPGVGNRFRFEVDLVSTANSRNPFRFEASSDWSLIGVDVEVISAQLQFAEGANRRKVILDRDGSSIAARFEAIVIGVTDDNNVNVQVLFNCMGRYSGMSENSFSASDSTPLPSPLATTANGDTINIISLEPDAAAPDLTIKIFKAGADALWMWIMEAPKAKALGKGSRQEIVTLPDTEGFAISLLKQCPDLRPGRHESTMRGIGEKIWNASPETFRVLYKDMRARFGCAFPIQIVTNEPHVPWEMMFPDKDSGIENPDHLFMTHPVCRWHGTLEGRCRSQFAKGSIASFVPVYRQGGQALPEAIAEGRWLASTLGATELEPSWEFFTNFWSTNLPEGVVAILHFAGHGENEPEPRIRLVDGYVSCADVHGGVMLGRRDGTFVVLNACETGNSDLKLGLVSGWAASLTAAEFGGVLAPLWRVQDAHASQVVRDFIARFYRGTPIGQALLEARKAARAASSTPFAYICHGDVTGTIG